MLKFVRKFIKWVLLYVLLIILTKLCFIIHPLWLNDLLVRMPFSINQEVALFIILSLLIPVFMMIKDHLLNYVVNLMSYHIGKDLLNEILHREVLDVKKYTANQISRIVNMFSWLVCDFYLYSLLDTVLSIIASLIMLLILAQYNVFISLFILVGHGLHLLVIYRIQHKITLNAEIKTKEENLFLSTFTHYIVRIKQVITRSKQTDCQQVLTNQYEHYDQANKTFSRYKSLSSSMGQTSFWIIRFASLLFCLILVDAYDMPLGVLQLAFFYSNEIGNCLQIAFDSLPIYSELKGTYRLVREFLDIEETKSSGHQEPFDTIILKNLSFKYDDKTIFNHINAHFEKGNIYVIKGENGSGKSTLMKIISGMYSKYEGEILLDNKPLKDYDKMYYFGHLISILTQDDLIFEGTIKENLLYDDENKINKICQTLRIENKDKYVLSKGENLSGGEKRKILLARALLDIQQKHPSLVIFDEPTYALEKSLVSDIKDKIKEIARESIVIVVSHDQDDFDQGIEINLDKIKN